MTSPERASMIRLLIVDDHPILRAGLAAVIDSEPDMKVVAQADDGRKAIECYRQHRLDVTLMDAAMPEGDGVTATAAIRSEGPDSKSVRLTTEQ